MALRLTDPVAPELDSPAPAALPAVSADVLVAQAQARLAAGDTRGYHALFADAARIADVHRRHHARKALLKAAIEAQASTPAAIARSLIAAAEAAVTLLEADPAEPVLLNIAGIAFYELGALNPAERLFRAARKLDGDLPHLASNIAELERRKRGNVKVLPQAAGAIRELAPRAKRVAAAARPATGQTLSLCMIVKDEEEYLGRCLAAVGPAVDEIIVVDTGSTDRTVEIAEAAGATVLHHTWTGDFAEARNVSFDAATCDWVMYLDADEILVEEDRSRLRELTGHTWREAFFLIETNFTGELEDGTAVTHNALRVFRNRPEYRFSGRLHEQIAHHLPSFLPERLEISRVRVEHYGYLGVVRDSKDKGRRNIELLEQQAAEQGETPFLHYNLGSEYAAGGDAQGALTRFRRSWEMLVGDSAMATYGFVPSLAGRLMKALRVCRQHEEALTFGDEVLARFPRFTDIVLEQALAARALGQEERAEQLLRQCIEWGDAPSRYSPTVGCGTYIATASLADLLRARGEHAEAEEMLRASLTEHPRFLAAIDPLAQCMLKRGAEPSEVIEAVAELCGEPTAGMHFMVAVALYEAGAVVEAEHEWRATLEKSPGVEHARVALAEALLSQNRLEEAAAEADAVDPLSACAPAAARTGLFARLAADEGPATAAVERARGTGMAAEELAVWEAWDALAAGAEVPGTLAPGSAPYLTTILEALLRIEAYEPFGKLLVAWEAVALPWRARREQLADVYWRRGYLESAADEWIAVSEQTGADAVVLRALSRIAAARGFDDDAELLAAEAEALAA